MDILRLETLTANYIKYKLNTLQKLLYSNNEMFIKMFKNPLLKIPFF